MSDQKERGRGPGDWKIGEGESDRKSPWTLPAADESGRLPGKLKAEAIQRDANRQQGFERPKGIPGQIRLRTPVEERELRAGGHP
jgi:hypothetical protein